MRCTVHGQNLRILSKSVRLMSKYSDYVNILVNKDGIVFQTFNDTKSAFCDVNYEKKFFSLFDFKNDFQCKVDIKSLLLPFRIINLDRLVEVCKMLMDFSFNRIIIEMKCKYSVYREYSIPYLENDIQKCPRLSDKIPQPTLKASARFFAETFKHFANSTEEATVWFFQDHLSFKTFIDVDDDCFFHLPSTSFSLLADEFVKYNYIKNLSITFNLRDVKAFLDFAVYKNQMINAYFQDEGKPLEFIFHNPDGYSSRIVVATIEFSESGKPEPPPFKKRNQSPQNNTLGTVQLSESLISSLSVTNHNNEVSNSHQTNTSQTDDHNLNSQQSTNELKNTDINPAQSNTKHDNSEGIFSQEDNINNDNDDNRERINEDMNNIIEILDNLPEFDNYDLISLTGTPLRQFQQRFLEVNDSQQTRSSMNEIAPDSDEELS